MNESLEEGCVWQDHRPEYNDPYKNFEQIRTLRPKPEPTEPQPEEKTP